MTRNNWLALTLALGLAVAARAQAPVLLSGPMAGVSSDSSVSIWLMTHQPGPLRLEYWPVPRPGERRVFSGAAEGEAPVMQAQLGGLRPDTRYAYRVLAADGRALSEVRFFRTQARQPRARDFSVLAGSCSYFNSPGEQQRGTGYGSDYEIFAAMAAQNPELTLWLGDHIYYSRRDLEEGTAQRMEQRWRLGRSFPQLQRLLGVGQHAAIWDAHDYGPNNSDKSFAHKATSLALFQRYWANASHGLPNAPGVFSRMRVADVDFFLLDDRWYRDADAAPAAPDKTMFGALQLAWLRHELKHSTAPFKVIAAGSRMLARRHTELRADNEGWHNFPEEREDFIAWLTRERIDGVLFLSGDIHYAHAVEWGREGSYPLLDLTCSALTSGVNRYPNAAGKLPGSVVAEHNFCSLEFSGPEGERVLRMSIRGVDGQVRWEKRLSAQALTHGDR